MKTKVSIISRMMIMTMAIIMTTSSVFAADEIPGIVTTGSSVSPAGDYVVQGTEDVFYYQGDVFDVYSVVYEDESMNLKIAVNTNSEVNSYVAYGSDYIVFYESTEEGFGVRKVKFTNPDAQKRFNVEVYRDQTILSDTKSVDKKDALELIAANLPVMKS